MKEIRRISVTDTVVERIQELIDSGEYEPGQKLPDVYKRQPLRCP